MSNKINDIKLVTVFTPYNEPDHLLVSSLLESEGINFYAKNSQLQDLFGAGKIGAGYNTLTGPIQIQVSEHDAERAKKLLEQYLHKMEEQRVIPETCPACESKLNNQDICPECGLNITGKTLPISEEKNEPTSNSNNDKKVIKILLTKSFDFNLLWLMGIGNIIAFSYAYQAKKF